MFTIYKSNQLNFLLEKACKIIQNKPLTNILQKEIFIHDNKVLFQYLNIFIAEKIGISANFKLYHPDIFIWKLFKIIYPEKKIKNTFTQSIMTWKIMNILDTNSLFQHVNIKKKDSALKKFKFSFLMANIFEKYLLYRPNWINKWEKRKHIKIIDKNEVWQSNLWREIIKSTKKNNLSHQNFSSLFSNFQLLTSAEKIKNINLPNRCFIVSSFSLNPSYIKIFKTISKYIHIYFLYVTPCKDNIFNYNTIQNNLSSIKEKTQKKIFLGHSLMTLWGKYEKIYSLNIMNFRSSKIVHCFKNIKTINLLNNIKNDILEFNKFKKNHKKRLLSLTDNSISINICYNRKHEIEILHKKILELLDKNSNVQPNDIVVTSFSIDAYTSFINSIFKSEDAQKQIPFFISTKHSKKTETTLSAFKKILDLSISRFSNEEILDLLDIPEIAKKFDISEEEINILYYWIEKTKIRWGVDETHQNNLSLPKNDQNTWFYGIEKLMLSFSMNNTENIWNNILPCALIDNSKAKLIGKLAEFINILNKWRKKLSRSQHLSYWHSVSKHLIHDFFYKSANIQRSLQIIQKNWTNMINDSFISNYKKKFL